MALFLFIIGLFIGSFFNVCIYRIPRGESIAFPPSHCPSCGLRIKPYDLVPVISYVFLRGRCRSCGERISLEYPAVEMLTGLIYMLLYLKYGFNIDLLKYMVLFSLLIIVSIIDLKHSIIPFKLMIAGYLAGIIFAAIGYILNGDILTYIFGFLIGGGVILIIVLISGGMGGGDIQLMSVIGLFLGFKLSILSLLLSFIIGACAGLTLILLKKKNYRDYIPFGPWLSLAACISIFIGDMLISWYISLY